MELKLFELKKENLTVVKYKAKFTELARFFLEYVYTEEKKAKRFQHGLKPYIRSKVVVFELTNYVAVI